MPGAVSGLYKHVGGYGRGIMLHLILNGNRSLKSLVSMVFDSSSSSAAVAVPLQPISEFTGEFPGVEGSHHVCASGCSTVPIP
jgi:hypothetical protein